MKGKIIKTIVLVLVVVVSGTIRCYFPWWSIPNILICLLAGVGLSLLWKR